MQSWQRPLHADGDAARIAKGTLFLLGEPAESGIPRQAKQGIVFQIPDQYSTETPQLSRLQLSATG